MLVTTVGVAPALAALRLAANTGLRGVPGLLGELGMTKVAEAGISMPVTIS